MNKGKNKESEISLNVDNDDDIIINRTSIDQTKKETDIIDRRSKNAQTDSSVIDIEKTENEHNHGNRNNGIPQNITEQNSLSNNKH